MGLRLSSSNKSSQQVTQLVFQTGTSNLIKNLWITRVLINHLIQLGLKEITNTPVVNIVTNSCGLKLITRLVDVNICKPYCFLKVELHPIGGFLKRYHIT